jgi:hypothetical protein
MTIVSPELCRAQGDTDNKAINHQREHERGYCVGCIASKGHTSAPRGDESFTPAGLSHSRR